jgi:hypothetical protein
MFEVEKRDGLGTPGRSKVLAEEAEAVPGLTGEDEPLHPIASQQLSPLLYYCTQLL